MDDPSVSSSVIGAFIRRFREQPPAPVHARQPPPASFWWHADADANAGAGEDRERDTGHRRRLRLDEYESDEDPSVQSSSSNRSRSSSLPPDDISDTLLYKDDGDEIARDDVVDDSELDRRTNDLLRLCDSLLNRCDDESRIEVAEDLEAPWVSVDAAKGREPSSVTSVEDQAVNEATSVGVSFESVATAEDDEGGGNKSSASLFISPVSSAASSPFVSAALSRPRLTPLLQGKSNSPVVNERSSHESTGDGKDSTLISDSQVAFNRDRLDIAYEDVQPYMDDDIVAVLWKRLVDVRNKIEACKCTGEKDT